MPLDQVGQSKFPNNYTYGGQTVHEFEGFYLFILENHVYRTAGHQHWEEAVNRGELRPEGISLNKKLFGKAVSTVEKDFLVYDKQKVRLFKLSNRKLISSVRGKEKRGKKTLIVLPLDAFTVDDVGKVPRKLR